MSGERVWSRLMQMAAIGSIPGDGVDRACLSEADRAARRLLIGWAAGAGVTVDDCANLFLRGPGQGAPVLLGSYMDSQPAGGRFDGIFGVVAALEVLMAASDHAITLARPLEVVAWTNEEGGHFHPGGMGSAIWSGARALHDFADATDARGIRFADVLRDHLAREPLPRRHAQTRPAAYLEAHIEQGPVLEQSGARIGVVTGVQGSRCFVVRLAGRSAHAGTSPRATRRDPIRDLARVMATLHTLMDDPDDVLRYTVGRIAAYPNTSNSVAEWAEFSIDLRHSDAGILRARGDAIAPTVRDAARETDATVTETASAAPIAFDPRVAAAVREAAVALALPWRALPSCAFHDAQAVAALPRRHGLHPVPRRRQPPSLEVRLAAGGDRRHPRAGLRRRAARVRMTRALALCLVASCAWVAPPSADDVFAAVRASPPRLRVFLQAMPKRGELHTHLWGVPAAEDFLGWAAEDGLCFEQASLSLVPPPCAEPVAGLAARHLALYGTALDALSMRGQEAGVGTQLHSGHDQFFVTFGRFAPVALHEPGRMLAVARALAAGDRVSYLELQSDPLAVIQAGQAAVAGFDANDLAGSAAPLEPSLPALLASARAETDAMEAEAARRLDYDAGPAPACDITVRYQASPIWVARGLPLPGGKYEVAAFCRNCLNQIHTVGGIDFDNLADSISESLIVGAQVSERF